MLDVVDNSMLSEIVSNLGDALAQGDTGKITSLFVDDCHWRDLVTFTWNIKTMSGKAAIADMLTAQLSSAQPSNFRIDEDRPITVEGDVTSIWILFDTAVARGEGHIRLKDGKIWTLFTAIVALKDHEEPLGPKRPFGTNHGVSEPTWKEQRETEQAELGHGSQPYALIIGGGQGGIALGARLRQLGVPSLIVERNERAGDSWRKRYKSLCLHDPVWYDHLPYLPFPQNW